MEFRVPQFIDVEDKLFGQFTLVQAVYLVGGVSMAYIVWTAIPGFLSLIRLPIIAGIILLALSLAFYPKDRYGKPFIAIMEAGFRFYFINPRLYTWKRVPKKMVPQKEAPKRRLSVSVPNISESNLKSLSWGLDVNQNV